MIPIRTRLTVLRDGSTTSASSVFCERRRCSVTPGACVKCGAHVANDVDGRAGIACPRTAIRQALPDSDPWSASAPRPAGLALTRRVVCVMEDAPLRAVAAALEAASGSLGIPVVDRNHRLVGLLGRGAATLALLGPAGDALAGEHAKPTSVALSESDSLGEAFRLMNSHHARELLVVNAQREIVGVLRDIDALQVVAAARRAPAVTEIIPPQRKVG
jgi:CBS domain-containing protein